MLFHWETPNTRLLSILVGDEKYSYRALVIVPLFLAVCFSPPIAL